VAAAGRALAGSRLVTLTGPGGVGKTRLALRLAWMATEVPGAFPDGVGFVPLAPLAPVAGPDLVAATVAQALGVRDGGGRPLQTVLRDALRGRTLLLVLDNCEHVLAGVVPLVVGLLEAAPGLRVLATSRARLQVAGEQEYPVPPLTLPSTGDPLGTAESEAVALFVERAREARPDFVLSAENAGAVAEVCHRLDGLPLALELAAARVRLFSVAQIVARLDDRFRLLTAGPRTALPHQQTLRATVDWSYALLAAPAQTLLRRLSVFAGGWTFEAAEAVAAGDGIQPHAVLDLLAQLVDESLVVPEEQRDSVRYRLLETIREYAAERLREAGEAERTRDRHLAYFLSLAEAEGPRLRGPQGRAAISRLEAEHANLREALEWSLAGDGEATSSEQRGEAGHGEAALRLCGALAWFWWMRSYHDEAWRWLTRALADAPQRSAARMTALHGAGWLAHHRRHTDLARALLGESLAIARERDDRWTVALALHHLGRVAYYEDDPATARALGEESLAIAEAVGDRWLIAWALHLLGLAAYIRADYPAARNYYTRSLALRRELGYEEGIGILLHLLGLVAVREGELAQASARFKESLALIQEVHGPWSLAMSLAGLSYVAAALGQLQRAVRLGGAASALSAEYNLPLIPLAEAILTEGLDLARRALGEPAYAAAWAAGQALSREESLAEALAVRAAPGDAAPGPGPQTAGGDPVAGLTPAEVEVLRRLAGGRTTKEIAAELVVAVSTVERHITHIYGKLGVRNRAEATAVALRHGLT
jgi:predicted ATPase/DNA-binding CsgD family transcriptional regulator